MKPHQVILLLAFAIGLAGYSLWPTVGEDFWFKSQAVMLFGLCSSYYLFCNKQERLTKAMVQAFAWCAFGNMVDEMAFDPTRVGAMEYVVASFGIATAMMNYHSITWTELARTAWRKNKS